MSHPPEPRAAIIAVGTELVAHGRSDTNGAAVSRMLETRGVRTVLRLQVEDDEAMIATAVASQARLFPIVIVTGGLGPTVDDVTREGVARAFGLTLREDPRLLGALRARFQARGRPFPAIAARQAMLPDGAIPLENSAGSAPGILLERPDGHRVFVLPGVPHEMECMMTEQVLPRLAPAQHGAAGALGLKVCGLTETEVQERILEVVRSAATPVSLSLLASAGEVTVILRGDDAVDLERVHAACAGRLGAHVFARDTETGIEQVAGEMLRARRLTIATAESCTGGLLGALITQVPGSTGWFLGGWVVYANELKIGQLGLDAGLIRRHGAVSAEVAEAMAVSARRLSGADLAVSITGIAGPEGGTPEKPVGLVFIGLDAARGCAVTRHQFPGDRPAVRLFAARVALQRVRLECSRDDG